MKLNDLDAMFPAYAAAGVSMELISAPGRGKSTKVRQLVKQMSAITGEEWGYADLFLATQTPPDLMGFQFKGEVTYEGKTFPITDPTAPTWFITETGLPVFAYERGIMFLDEFGQGQTDVKAAAAELLLNKRIGKWKLPDGWIVVAASNRTSDRSGVTKSLDFVINRRMEIHLTDDLQSWLDWADTTEMLPLTKAFAAQNPQIVFTEGVPDKQGPWCTPRSLEMADKVIRAMQVTNGGKLRVDALAVESVAGLVGQAAAAQYFAFIRLENELPKYDAIVKDPSGTKIPEKPDAQMLLCYNLAHLVTAKDAEKVIEYVQRLPKDFSVTFVKTACQREPMLITKPGFMKWVGQNAALLAVVGK